MKPEALRARIDFPGGQIKPRERSAGPSADSGRATRARPFRPEPPSSGGRATGRASTRARGFAAYPRQRPLIGPGPRSCSDSAPALTAWPGLPAGNPPAAPSSGRPAESLRTRQQQRRPRPPLPHRAGPTAAATRAAAPMPGLSAGPPPTRPGGPGWRRGPARLTDCARPPRARYSSRRPAPPPIRTRRLRLQLRRPTAVGGRRGADTHSGVGCSGS